MISKTTTGHNISGRVNPITHGVMRFELTPASLSHVVGNEETIKLAELESGNQVIVEDVWLEVNEPFSQGTEFAVGDAFADNNFLRYTSVSVKGSFGQLVEDKGFSLVNERTASVSENLTLSIRSNTSMADQESVAFVSLYVSFKEVVDATLIETEVPASTLASAGTKSVPTADFMYTGPDKDMPEDVGGIDSGSNFSEESENPGGPIPFNDLITMLLYPYQDPAFTSFSIAGQDALVEVGTSLSANIAFTWSTSNDENIQEDSLNIKDSGNIVLADQTNDGAETYQPAAAIVKTSPSSHTFRIEGTNTKGAIFARNLTITWGLRVYFGISANASLTTPVGIVGLGQSGIKSNYPGNYSFSAGVDQYKYIAIPEVWVGANGISIKDTGGLGSDVAHSFVGDVDIESNGVVTSYKIFRSTNKLGGALTVSVSAG